MRCGSVTFGPARLAFSPPPLSLRPLAARVPRVGGAPKRARRSQKTEPFFDSTLSIDLTSPNKSRCNFGFTRLPPRPTLAAESLSELHRWACVQVIHGCGASSVAVLALGLNLDPALVASIECVQFCWTLSNHRQHSSRFVRSISSRAYLSSAHPRAQTSDCRRFPLGVAGCCSSVERRCRAGRAISA